MNLEFILYNLASSKIKEVQFRLLDIRKLQQCYYFCILFLK